MNETTRKHLENMHACEDAVEWASEQSSLRQAWRVCKRGDWMLWYAARVGMDHKRLVWVACQCARLALKHVPDGEERPRKAIELAERWASGERVTSSQLRRTACAAHAAYVGAYDAAADAAYVAYDAAAYAAADAYARTKVLARCATLVRREWPTLPMGDA